jgi:hypothetical protein
MYVNPCHNYIQAKALHAKAVSLAQKAIEQRTTFHVEQVLLFSLLFNRHTLTHTQ